MQLGFLVFEVSDLAAWQRFATTVLGFVDVGQGRFRMDGHAWRIETVEGEADDLQVVGWELSEEELEERLSALARAGVAVVEGDASVRGARRRFCCTDPAGVPVELVTGLARADAPFSSPVVPGGYVADALGLGHLVLNAPDPAASRQFYETLLGFTLSDRIQTTFFGHDVDLSFFHINPRHHSLAFGGRQKKRLNHFLVEVTAMDEVGLAYDRVIKAGARIMLTLGRHPNDGMFSFYALTPSGFQFEFGWGGREITAEGWTPTTYDRISDWGHHPPQVLGGRR